eukprot:jgi/Orpsp1_1/1186068/evm.model.c7180000096731.1
MELKININQNYILEIEKILKNSEEDVLNNIKSFFENNEEVNIDNLNSKDYDLLIYAIKNNCSISVIEYIINNCKKYKTNLNFETLRNEIPLFITLKKAIPDNIISNKNENKNEDINLILNQKYLEIFNILIEHGADINF